MANLCKFDKKQYQVSYDSGVTWENVIPEQIDRGDNMIEYDSQDCSSVDTMYRWRTLDGQYLCDDNEKWTKEVQEESYNNGLTWYASYPTVYKKGTYVAIDENYCNDKFIGHYGGPDEGNCPRFYKWNGYKCVYLDPLKVVKCDDNTTLTPNDTSYYINNYLLIQAEIGNCVTAIGQDAFFGCTSLTSITIPNTVKSIDKRGFESCESLSSITIPDSVTSIGEGAFVGCLSLKSITIGSGIRSIGLAAIRDCTNLQSITCLAPTPPSLSNDAFGNTNNCPIYVPCEKLCVYENAWSSYASRIQPIESCDMGMSFLAHYSNGTSYSAVCDCNSTSLTTSKTKPSGYEYTAMTQAEIGNCITTIDNAALSGCSSLTSVTMSDSVSSIGGNAFSSCSGLTSVTIGSGVTSIGTYAFSGCSSLTSITVNATTPPTLGSKVFDNTNNCPIFVPCGSAMLYCGSWSSYASRIQPIESCEPTGATKYYAAYPNGNDYWLYCDGDATLTTEMTKPYTYASAMTSVAIGDCVTSIDDSAFWGCTSLKSVTISSGIKHIGSGTFQNCSGLTSITIEATFPPSLQYYRNSQNKYVCYTFDNTNNCPIYVPCESVPLYRTASDWTKYSSRVHGFPSPCTPIPTGATKVYCTYSNGETYFKNCDTSTTLTSGETKPNGYNFSTMTSAEIGDCVMSIGNYAFSNYYIDSACRSLTSVTISNSVTSIGAAAFRYCISLTSINIPNSVTSIGGSAFENCGSLTNILFDENSQLTTIGDSAFQNCTSLTSANIPNSVTTIGNYAFGSCSGLTSITIGSGVTSISYGAFRYCRSLTNINIPNSVTSIGGSAFYSCSGLTSITIGSGVTTIGDSAFEYCSGLTSVEIPNSVTSIGRSAFEYCSGLTSITILDSVTSIGEYAFNSCYKISALTIPNSVTTIGARAFASCRDLTSITIGSGVTSIGGSAFQYCRSLTNITINATTPPTFGNYNVFTDTNIIAIYVPSESLEAYKSASGWSYYADRIQPIT